MGQSVKRGTSDVNGPIADPIPSRGTSVTLKMTR